MLYNDPHPVHRRMAESIGAVMVRAEGGGLLARFASAATSRYPGPVILEGGAPLVEGAALRWLRRAPRIVLLAADETLHDIEDPLDHYTNAERAAHRLALRAVDGVIAVSKAEARRAERLTSGPVEVAEPFVLEPLGSRLDGIDPDLSGRRVLCVGENRPSMNQAALVEACDRAGAEAVLAGSGTDDLPSGRGWVEEGELVDLYAGASLYCLPATAGAHPVTVLEAMRAGVPPMVSSSTGTAVLVESISPGLVCGTSPGAVSDALEWYFGLDEGERARLSSLAREKSVRFREEDGAARFANAWRGMEARL